MNADSTAVTRKTVSIFDQLQFKSNRETNLLALACAFILACSSMKVPPQDGFQAAKNLMADPLRAEGIRHGFAAVEQHLREDY